MSFSTTLINIFGLYLLSILYCKLTVGIAKSSKHLFGKVVLITGGNSGIGYETARDMAERGARVIIGCRSEEKGITARNKLIACTGNNDVHHKTLDLACFKSVRKFAEDILQSETRLDILINNAGIQGTEKVETDDGLLLEMQTNHFGPFLLTLLLLPLLKSSAPSRIINVSSVAHIFAKLDFENLNGEKRYNTTEVYCVSKLCNVLSTKELAKRLRGTGVTVNALHPGIVDTPLLWNFSLFRYILPIVRLGAKTPTEGAQTTIHLAVSPEVQNVSGKYFQDCRETRTSKIAQDKEIVRKVWEISEKIVFNEH